MSKGFFEPIHTNQNRISNYLFWLILCTGIFLRFYQYLMGRSLWEDEAHLALNIMNRNFTELTKPLDFIQAAPILFLFIVKAFTQLFGPVEQALRAFPFITSILTLPLCYYLFLEITKSKTISLAGFFIYSVNLHLIYFSSELKPYGVDVSFNILLLFLYVSKNSFVSGHRSVLLTVAGTIALLCSLSAFITLFCLGLAMLLNWFKTRQILKSEFMPLSVWLVTFILNYLVFIHNHPSTQQQVANYSAYFCPTNLLSCEFVTFLKLTINDVFFDLNLFISKDYGFKYLVAIFLLVSVIDIFKNKKYQVLLLFVSPILIHLTLSALHIYPFIFRMVLYQVPALIFLLCNGILITTRIFPNKFNLLAKSAFVLFSVFMITRLSLLHFPLWFREIKPVINFVNQNSLSNHVYVFDPINTYTYYRRLGFAKKEVHRALPWDIDSISYNNLMAAESNHYFLFYSFDNPKLIRNIIQPLVKKNLALKQFQYKNYGVVEVKPFSNLYDSIYTVVRTLDYNFFDSKLRFGDENSVAIWSNSPVKSHRVKLLNGQYLITVTEHGTPAGNEYPHLNLLFNNQLIGSYKSTQTYSPKSFNLTLNEDIEGEFSVVMDNDIQLNSEDRNAFLLNLSIKKKK